MRWCSAARTRNPGTLNDALQHQHGVDLRGTADVELDRVQISDTYGDCVYVGQPWSTVDTWSSDVHMHDSSCTGAGRNGIALTAGRNVLVETSSFERIALNTFGLEPNGAGFGARERDDQAQPDRDGRILGSGRPQAIPRSKT